MSQASTQGPGNPPISPLQAEAAQGQARRQVEDTLKIKKALKAGNLAICVGSGVTLFSTADNEGKALPRMFWSGLIREGLTYLIQVKRSSWKGGAFPRGMQRAIEDVESGDPKDLIHAATYLRETLGVNRFPTWIDSVFSPLVSEIRHPAMLEALRKLHNHGASLLTTNYDGLLEHVCEVNPAHADDPPSLTFGEFKQNKLIFHPHGYYKRPRTIVLDAFDYYDIQRESAVRDLLRNLLQFQTILFVGCGHGLEDPNMGALLGWLGEKHAELQVPHQHYVLLKNDDDPIEGPLNEIFYGNAFEDLAPWLERLLDDDTSAPDGTMNDISIESERWKIHQWLSPIDQTRFHCDMLDKQHLDNGVWFTRSAQFTSWMKGPSAFLWSYGSEACGKTVLCSSIINEVQESCRPANPARSRDSIAFFYCESYGRDRREDLMESHEMNQFLTTVITQLCPPRYVFEPLQILYRDCTKRYPGRRPTSAQLQDVLVKILIQLNSTMEAPRILQQNRQARQVQPGETFLIVDGLDKVPSKNRDKFLRFFARVEAENLEHIHVMVSARPFPSLSASVRTSGRWMKIHVDTHIRNDIRNYVLNVLEDNHELRSFHDAVKRRIVDGVLSKCDNISFERATSSMESLLEMEKLDPPSVLRVLGIEAQDSESAIANNPRAEHFLATGLADMNHPVDEERAAWADRWLDEYDEFLESSIEPVVELSPNALPRVRVALLSSELDITDPYLQGCAERLCARKSWLGRDEPRDASLGSYYAALLLRTAPDVDLFVAELGDLDSSASKSQAFLDRIIAAMQTARNDWKVDIIVCAFAFIKYPPVLDQAISLAQASNILVLSAAPIGPRVTASHAQLITINSLDGKGNSSLFTGRVHGENTFSILGEEVESSWPRASSQIGQVSTRRLSGSSVAVVIAAGMTATLLLYARLELSPTEEHAAQYLETWHGKKTLMSLMCVVNLDKRKCLVPWKLFHRSRESVQAEILVALSQMI